MSGLVLLIATYIILDEAQQIAMPVCESYTAASLETFHPVLVCFMGIHVQDVHLR